MLSSSRRHLREAELIRSYRLKRAESREGRPHTLFKPHRIIALKTWRALHILPAKCDAGLVAKVR